MSWAMLIFFCSRLMNWPWLKPFKYVTTVHKDVTERLPLINDIVAARDRHILDNNKAERHLRGGEATKRKYQELKEEEEELS